jgi:protein-S-isoprenylcysteine O-methyltransferase Ste14
MAYRHTQIGTVILVSLGLAMLLILGLLIRTGWHPTGVAVLCILAVAAWLFSSLTIEVKDATLEWRFGPGLIRKRCPLAEVREVQAVRNPWYYGSGIHWTPQGWLYNVSGVGGVAITLASGKRFRIGTDEPQALAEAIRQAAGLAE